MQKKADLSLSIHTIVILILAITMLGLGLAFMRNVFGKAAGEFKEIAGEVQKQMIDQMKSSNKIIDLSGVVYEIKQGEKKTAYIGFKNEENGPKNFTIVDITSNSMSNINDSCGLGKNHTVLEYKKTSTEVQPGATSVLPINIKSDISAEKDSCLFEIKVKEGGTGVLPTYAVEGDGRNTNDLTSPNGAYYEDGQCNGKPRYKKTDSAYFLYYDSLAWDLTQLWTDCNTYGGSTWQGLSGALTPEGQLDPVQYAEGTAIISLPTKKDYDQSIQLTVNVEQ